MEIISDELRNNGIDLNMRTLSYHINYLLQHYGDLYREIEVRSSPDEISEVFDRMNVNNFGRGIASLTFLYMLKESVDQTRNGVRLVVPVFRELDLSSYKIERSLTRRIASYFWHMIINIRQYF